MISIKQFRRDRSQSCCRRFWARLAMTNRPALSTYLNHIFLCSGLLFLVTLVRLRSARHDMLAESSALLLPENYTRPNAGLMDVYVLAMPEREATVKRHLHQLRPFKIIPGFKMQDVSLGQMQASHILTKEDWDYEDKRIRKTYGLTKYMKPGEIACTLGHRRILEDFLRNSRRSAALVLEDDAVPVHPRKVTLEIEHVLRGAPDGWDVLQLGPCWDINCAGNDEAGIQNEIQLSPSRGFELCSHSLLVSRKGAEKMMQYSLPMVLPYDHTLMLLSRNGFLDVYYSTMNIFGQDDGILSLLKGSQTGQLPRCDPWSSTESTKKRYREMNLRDRQILQRVSESPIQELVSVPTRHMKNAVSHIHAESVRESIMKDLCEQGKIDFCRVNRPKADTSQFCQMLGGGRHVHRHADSGSQLFLAEMDKAGLDGIVVWGLRPEKQHTHEYIHSAIHKSLAEALAFSSKPRHLCYVQEDNSIDLGRDLYHEESRGRLAKSLVFASSKHMTWSKDPGFLMLPVEATSRYIFHGETPRPHTVLKRDGFAIEWEAWGPDGNIPVIDSDFFQRGEPLDRYRDCVVDYVSKTMRCYRRRLLVQPWAAYLTPSEIETNKKYAAERLQRVSKQTEMPFQGTIWDCNVENFLRFTMGCRKEEMNVVRYGERSAFSLVEKQGNAYERLLRQPNFYAEKTNRSLQDLLLSMPVVYAPAFQGRCHLTKDGSFSYVADRILNLIAVGVFPMTNNVASVELLQNSSAIVYDSRPEELCAKTVAHHASLEILHDAMDLVAKEHTYISRLATALEFLNGIQKSA